MKAVFIGAAALALAGCSIFDPAPRPMGPVRLVEAKPVIPEAAFECRPLPSRPADYFDGLEHAEWINSLWHVALDCRSKLHRAGELYSGKGD